MNEERAREILKGYIQEDGHLFTSGLEYVCWTPPVDPELEYNTATLDGSFTADELEAIAWWMRNKHGK